jgi:putative Ca2+/H+ antiporter (TMEM165/GDT1 family)
MRRAVGAALLLASLIAALAREQLASGGVEPAAPPPPRASRVGFVPAFFEGLSMTIATELGDKTFMIAAVLAMRYNRALVFAGAVAALLVMTVLSVCIGVAVPALLPRVYTHYAAAALFAYFGGKLLLEARAHASSAGGEHAELAEAEAELREVRRQNEAIALATRQAETLVEAHEQAQARALAHINLLAAKDDARRMALFQGARERAIKSGLMKEPVKVQAVDQRQADFEGKVASGSFRFGDKTPSVAPKLQAALAVKPTAKASARR